MEYLLIVGMAVAGLIVGLFFGLVFLSVLTYVVKNLWPPGRRVALWAARLQNFIPLLILYVILMFLVIGGLLITFRLPTIAMLLALLLLLFLVIIWIVVATLMWLGLFVYITRLSGWLWGGWTRLLGGLVTAMMGLKIKHDVDKRKDKNMNTHFSDMRRRLSDEAEQTRRRISGGGKKT